MANSNCISGPFSHLKIDDFHKLDELQGRTTCPECNRSRKYFCYTCYCPVTRLKKLTPRVELPLHIDIIKHPLERDGKSTACHAAVISPDQVHIHTFPRIPDFDPEKTVLVFPGVGAVQLVDVALHTAQPAKPVSINSKTAGCDEKYKTESVLSEHDKVNVVGKHNCDNRIFPTNHNNNSKNCKSETCPQKVVLVSPDECALKYGTNNASSDSTGSPQCALKQRDRSPGDETRNLESSWNLLMDESLKEKMTPCFDRVLFIDCTWNQTHGMLQDERLQGLRKVELKSRTSQFWRHQKGSPDTYLSTIEAIYYFVRDYHDLFISTPYDGRYDNLLFFFSCLYEKANKAIAERLNEIK